MDYTEIDQLVIRLRQGDRSAWGRLVTLFEPKINQLAAAVPPSDREDCRQDLCIALYQGALAFDPDRGAAFNAYIAGYLGRTALKRTDGEHHCYAGAVPDSRVVSLDQPADDDSDASLGACLADSTVDVEGSVVAAMTADALARTVFGPGSVLSRREQQTLYEHFWQDRPIARIAADHHQQWTTAASRLKRALCKLASVTENLNES